ncbi:MAG TPA: M24 family metallopeptidase [Gemmatimonadales bacterium]
MSGLAELDRAELKAALKEAGADGWLLYDFHGVNPVMRRMVGSGGLATRRLFVWLPADGPFVAVVHKIELQPLTSFPGDVRPYAAWQELHQALGAIVKGRTVAMEVSTDDAVPYLDRVPAGVVELVSRLGGKVRTSAPLVTRFAARWTPSELADHRIAAEQLAEIAQGTIREVVREIGVRESAVQRRVMERMTAAGLVATHGPIVGFGPNAANPHYEPVEGKDRALEANQVVLLDLFGGRSRQTVFADQTWMGFAGREVPADVAEVWRTVRDARDAAVQELARRWKAREPVTGAMLDQAARDVIAGKGYGEWFVHRTGHSIDQELHGSGPHLDSYETNDDRLLMAGVGFSVEPGVYLTGRFGVRSEINVVLHADGPEVTPRVPQRDLILPG